MKSKYPSSVKRGDKGLASRKPILTYVCTQGVVIQLGEDNSGGKEEEIGRERWEAPQVEGPHQNIGAQVSTNFLLAVAVGSFERLETPRVSKAHSVTVLRVPARSQGSHGCGWDLH